MESDVFSPRIPAGVTFLLIISSAIPAAAGLREEAASYRAEGYQAQQRGDKTAALAGYQKAAALDPAYATPNNDTGVLLEEEGRLDEAERAYQRALELDPNYLEAHANIAMLYERTGQREKAIYHWMKRYQLGDAADAGTARAQERLTALGVFKTHPGMKGQIYSRRRVAEDELEAHAQSREDFHKITEKHGDWP